MKIIVSVLILVFAPCTVAETLTELELFERYDCMDLRGEWSEEHCSILSEGNEPLSSLASNDKWYATGDWTRSENGRLVTIRYEGTGSSKEAAFNSAKRNCKFYEGGFKSATCDMTASVLFRKVSVVDKAWSGWVNWGGGVGNPCPKGMERGREIGQAYRVVGLLPPKPQTKHKFECIKEVERFRENI
ncbi:TPA: hypothetical protein ACPJ0L_001830 [Vibrio alginolyticus]|uniref:hypothetical protein n=1 Tax=Vibrio parahaemolyticus TaxID=670 RepID=UPI0006B28BBA|nr:hypothetical protein [Vibrio parahaemolyticus]EGQ8472053.1 hypothetical protein [Vibrio alginolyticus]EJL6749481.1 hypothetical protein [Vibrio alginolyticus]EJL6856197.1 hypothetical protein [Vibrio alginolyticus]ELA9243885.1 hypothetical protein [Vibrio alginolyticus]ELB2840594.1 hypothetical protein [Vibrio alginolyticus]